MIGPRVFSQRRELTYPIIDRGHGIYLFDRSGKRYYDATGGFHVVSIGHGVKEIAEAYSRQAERVAFASNRLFTTSAQEALAADVLHRTPGSSQVYFVSGGSEANEVALQIVHEYHKARGKPTKTKFIGRWNSYHGFTIATVSMGGHRRHRGRLGAYLSSFPHIPAPDCRHCPLDAQLPSCRFACATALDIAIEEAGPETVGAFIAEPICGTTLSALVPPPGYYERIRAICDRHDVLFVADEVVTGFGRTGEEFGIEHWGVLPDLITGGKALGSGYTPIGMVAVGPAVAEQLSESGSGSAFLRHTFSGNAAGCAVALAVQAYKDAHKLVLRCRNMGDYLLRSLHKLRKASQIVGTIRGKGLLIGFELVGNQTSEEPFPRELCVQERLVSRALENGLILTGGTGTGVDDAGDHISITPPFVISEAECDAVIDILAESLTSVEQEITGDM